MKTRIFLTTAILAVSMNISFAGNASGISPERPVSYAQIDLAPEAPAFADFRDLVPEPVPSAVSLSPVTPSEAGFEDESADENNNSLLNILSPSTPNEADFEDDITPEYSTL